MSEARPGWVEAGARLLRVTLQAPRVKHGLDTVLGHLDPDFAQELVDAALETDPEVPHAFLGALPDALNVMVEVSGGLVRAVCSRPLPLVREALDRVQSGVRVRRLGQTLGVVLGRLVVLRRDTVSRAPALTSEIAAGLRAGLQQEGVGAAEALGVVALPWIEAVLTEIEQQMEQDPELGNGLAHVGDDLEALVRRHAGAVRQVLVPLLRPLLRPVVDEEPRP